MVHTLRSYGIQAIGPLCWEVGGRTYDLQNQHGLQEAIAQHVKDTLWAKLATRRTGYQGMAQGRDDVATNSWRNSLQDDRNQAFLDIILTDGVYTPMRSHLSLGQRSHLPLLPGTGGGLEAFCQALPGHAQRAGKSGQA